MSDSVDQASALLFPQGGSRKVTNVKFFLGSKRDVTASDLADELVKAEEQVRSGQATRVFDIDGNLND